MRWRVRLDIAAMLTCRRRWEAERRAAGGERWRHLLFDGSPKGGLESCKAEAKIPESTFRKHNTKHAPFVLGDVDYIPECCFSCFQLRCPAFQTYVQVERFVQPSFCPSPAGLGAAPPSRQFDTGVLPKERTGRNANLFGDVNCGLLGVNVPPMKTICLSGRLLDDPAPMPQDFVWLLA